jgi:hypothetical protein
MTADRAGRPGRHEPADGRPADGRARADVPPSAGLAELAIALGYSYLSVEECVTELLRAGGTGDLERAQESLVGLEPSDPHGVEQARRLLRAALPTEPEHVVAFYEDESFLSASTADFLLAGLRKGESVLVIATREHRAAFEAALVAAGHDVERSRREGRYTEVDATERLRSLVVDGVLDTDGLRRDLDAWLAEATVGGRGARLYGEMVALLWEAGDLGVALELEEHWEGVTAGFPLPVLCGYPMRGFDTAETTALFHAVCARHTGVTTESYARLADPDPGSGQRRNVVLERQEPGGRPARRARD